MQKITPCLWFDFKAEEAVHHYLGIFKNGRILETSRYGDAMPELKGKVLVMRFELEGREFTALNGGPQYPFSEAISLSVDCADRGRSRPPLGSPSEGGSPGRCGWLKDKFGLSWQIVPRALVRLLSDPDPVKASRVMQAMMPMSRIDIAALERAYAG
ncbi:MAG: VOC family protein [Burkholderiaceae bacterium]|nr:VOC family protein [Burkholderiaceae bacterium]